MENKPLILSLLKAELKNTKLINGLEAAGLCPDDYYLGLSTHILLLMGFENAEDDDELHDFYFSLLDKKCAMEQGKFMESIKELALEVYERLTSRLTQEPEKSV